MNERDESIKAAHEDYLSPPEPATSYECDICSVAQNIDNAKDPELAFCDSCYRWLLQQEY